MIRPRVCVGCTKPIPSTEECFMDARQLYACVRCYRQVAATAEVVTDGGQPG